MLVSNLVRRGFRIVYGGGNVGLMGIVADTALAEGGEVVGVIPRHLVDRELAHSELSRLIITESMAERKTTMADLSDACVALPGGIGTLEELTEVLSGAQLGLHNKPCALLNVRCYFEHLLEFLNQAVGEGFVRSESRDLLLVESDPDRMVDRLAEAVAAGSAAFDRWSTDPPADA